MRVVCGPPWLRVGVTFGRGTERYRYFLLEGGAREGRSPADVKIVVEMARQGAGGEEPFGFRDGRLSVRTSQGRGEYRPDARTGEVEVGEYGGAFFETFLRQVFLWEALLRGAVVLHSCGIGGNGGAVVSCGPSGSGKSTLARLIGRRLFVYSDEINAVTASGAVYPLPFRGSGGVVAAAGGEALKAITFHRPGARWGQRRVPPAEAYGRVSENVFLPLGATAGLKAMAFVASAALAERVPCYDVTVPLDGDVAGGFGELLRINEGSVMTRGPA